MLLNVLLSIFFFIPNLVDFVGCLEICPNSCSHRGICNFDRQCECFPEYSVVADCSQKKCPYDRAWVGKAYDSNAAHDFAECSNMGYCDRNNGLCQCFAGYEGLACERMSCLDNCNGHGSCQLLGELYVLYTKEKIENYYSSWDANHTTMCVCDIGYAGPSCEFNICPKGDDPLTPFTHYPSITINTKFLLQRIEDDPSVHAWYSENGYFRITFQNQSLFIPIFQYQNYVESSYISSPLNAIECSQLFENNWKKVVNKVSCVPSLTSDGVQYTITFISFPQLPYENNIFKIHSDGSLDMSEFVCESYLVRGLSNSFGIVDNIASCDIIYTTPSNATLPEYASCSNRGICMFPAGTCQCHDYFFNANCGRYLVVPDIETIKSNIYLLQTELSSYTQNILSMISTSNPILTSSNYIRVNDNNISHTHPLFAITGLGDVDVNYGYCFIENGMDIEFGGLTVGDDEFTYLIETPVLGKGLLTLHDSGLFSDDGDINITPAPNHPLIGIKLLSNSGLNITSTSAAKDRGYLNISSGGLASVYGGVTISNQGLKVLGNINVGPSQGLYVNAGGMTVSGGFWSLNSLSIAAGGLDVAKTLAITGNGLIVNGLVSTNAIFTGYDRGLTVTQNGMTISAGGLSINNGVTVSTSGLVIQERGLSARGGVVIDNNCPTCNISNGLVVSLAGVSVETSGMRIGDGIIVKTLGVTNQGGMKVTSGGGSVLSGGLNVNDAISVMTGGLTAVSGMTVVTEGIFLALDNVNVRSFGLTCYDVTNPVDGCLGATSGMQVSAGGVSVTAGGLKMTDGDLNVASTGVRVHGGLNALTSTIIGGLTVQTGGIHVSDGFTVASGGLVMSQGGATSDRVVVANANAFINLIHHGGMEVADTGVTVATGGIRVGGGITVASDGMSVVGSATLLALSGLYVDTEATIVANGAGLFGGLKVTANGLKAQLRLEVVSGGVTTNSMSVVQGGLMVAGDGISVMTGGMTLQSGGVTIIEGGLVAANSAGIGLTTDTLVSVEMTISTGGLDVKSGGVDIEGGGMSGSIELLAATNGLKVLDGGMSIGSNLFNSNGKTIFVDPLSGGLKIDGGLSIADGGLKLDGFVFSGAGLVVNAIPSQVLVASVSEISTTTLTVSGGLSVLDSGVDCTGRVNVISGAIEVNDGVIVDAGSSVTGRVNVESDGLLADSIILNSGGMTVDMLTEVLTGGLKVVKGGLTVVDGLKITNGALSVSGGGGFNILAGHVTIQSSGLITESIRVLSLGLSLTDSSNSGMTIQSNGLSITEAGLTLTSGGFKISNGAMLIKSGGLSVTGGLTVYGATQLQSSPVVFSDRNLKHNITPLKDSLSKVSKLRGVYFSWNNKDSELSFDGDQHIGMIAQEVRDIYPELVQKMKDSAYLGISYPDMIPVVVEAVKELNDKVDNLSRRYLTNSSTAALKLSSIRNAHPTSEKLLAINNISQSKNITNIVELKQQKLRQHEVDKSTDNNKVYNDVEAGDCKDLVRVVESLILKVELLESLNMQLIQKIKIQNKNIIINKELDD